MSANPRRALAVKNACTSFARNRDLLVVALGRRESRLCLDALVEVCGLHLEQTGGTLVTATYRAELGALRQLVEERPVLAAVPPPSTPKDPMPLFEAHEIAMPCLACGHPGLIDINGALEYECRCSYCYDGDPESGRLQAAAGNGRTVGEAVAAWVDEVEDAIGLAVWPTGVAQLARAELQRQAGWTRTHTERGTWISPEPLTHDASDYCAVDGHTVHTREERCAHWEGAQ